MEELARKYLKEVTVICDHITGYLESDKGHDDFMTDIDNTTSGFVKKWSGHTKDEESARRILWQASNKNAKIRIDFFGNPFKAFGSDQLECVHGGHKRIHKNVLAGHPGTVKRKRKQIPESKKLGCTAELTVRKIVHYPQYNVENDLNGASCYMERKIKAETMQRLDADLCSNKENVQEEIRYYYHIPLESSHSNHEVLPTISSIMTPKIMKREVHNRIGELVANGIRKPDEIENLLKEFVCNRFKDKEIKPSIFDRSWYPQRKDIKNHIYIASLQQKLSQIDHNAPQSISSSPSSNNDSSSGSNTSITGNNATTSTNTTPVITEIIQLQENEGTFLNHNRRMLESSMDDVKKQIYIITDMSVLSEARQRMDEINNLLLKSLMKDHGLTLLSDP